MGLTGALLVALTPCFVEAKPNKDLVNGCTPKQVRSEKAKACIDRMQADILAGKPDAQTHYLLCRRREMFCCTGGNGTPRDCEYVGEARVIPPGSQPDATVRDVKPADRPVPAAEPTRPRPPAGVR
ncbi:hypothetical protein [Thiobacter aerophilum]|uniref:Uncharacterized protein n=1 Tax=Thiobacter aerophilum TaxID=3121275 RepID=A0ABV0EF50_9BURK